MFNPGYGPSIFLEKKLFVLKNLCNTAQQRFQLPLTFRHRGAKKTLRAECNLIKRNIFTSIKHYKQLNERVSFS